MHMSDSPSDVVVVIECEPVGQGVARLAVSHGSALRRHRANRASCCTSHCIAMHTLRCWSEHNNYKLAHAKGHALWD